MDKNELYNVVSKFMLDTINCSSGNERDELEKEFVEYIYGKTRNTIRNTIDEYFLDVGNCEYINSLIFKDKFNFASLVLIDIKNKILSHLLI